MTPAQAPQASKPPAEPLMTPALRAFCFPFFAFMFFMMLPGWIQGLGRTEFLLAQPKYWIFPLQTLVCGGLLAFYWRYYSLSWPKQGKDWAWTLGIAILVLGIWISPQEIFGAAPRLEGFDPNVFVHGSPTYWGSLALRFARLVIVVPLLEEIFWRGFLLRYLIREDFEKVPFGTATRFSFLAVVLCFGLAHLSPDFLPGLKTFTFQPGQDFWTALITSALYNLIAIRTRSLAACVVAHAITNLILGLYIMQTGQWGFW